ncbi:hypothetical protein DACRYDRAFT_100110 [Dacryopinax primogenitus]|uniref:Uncharacterized protein n=1 Tax=Dacryopinax primogenitus (strain DJM 731) TaxID=1858805 RepID=M5G7G6_DACPD|nr:uncharacterized protein DACRYDRAFT_100110 [Dacryopinax primogenitus]EJU01807.1 hypothetical protein DACRYDRAFT_100110 [Dacryopinax primogenitus]
MVPAKAYLMLTLVVLVYGTILYHHTRWTFWNYRAGRVRLLLTIHSLSGLSEVGLFHLRPFLTIPSPALHTSLALLQALTLLSLVRTLRRGLPLLTRPSYQAGGILRLVLLFLPQPYPSAGLQLVHGFAFTRLFIWMFQTTGVVRGGREVYAFAVFGAGLLVCAGGGRELGLAYAALVGLIAALNRWTTAQLAHDRMHSDFVRALLQVLVFLGFAELETVRLYDSGLLLGQTSSDNQGRSKVSDEMEEDDFCLPEQPQTDDAPEPTEAEGASGLKRMSVLTPPGSPGGVSRKKPALKS